MTDKIHACVGHFDVQLRGGQQADEQAAQAVADAPLCESSFFTPNGGLIHSASLWQRINSSIPFLPTACLTPPPPGWSTEFTRASLVRHGSIPTEHGNLTTTTQWWRDGGLSATAGQAWLVATEEGDVVATLGGTCGILCEIAARIYDYLHARLRGMLAEDMAVLEIAAGTGTIATCLTSGHNVGVTLSVTPEEYHDANENMDFGHGLGAQSFVSVARGAPTLLDFASVDRQLPLQSGSFHAVVACRAAGGSLAAHEWFWFELQRVSARS